MKNQKLEFSKVKAVEGSRYCIMFSFIWSRVLGHWLNLSLTFTFS